MPSVVNIALETLLCTPYIVNMSWETTLFKPCVVNRAQETSLCNTLYSKHVIGNIVHTLYSVCLFVGCLTSQQQAGVSQGRICSDNFTCCHTEIEVADQTFYLTQSQYTDTEPTSPSADPITPGAWQGCHWSANFLSHWYDSTPKKFRRKRDSNSGSSALEADAFPLSQ